MLGQIDVRRSVSAADAGPGELDLDLPELRHVLDRDDHLDLQRLADSGIDDRHRPLHPPTSAYPPRNSATSSSGRCVADSPIRCGGAR